MNYTHLTIEERCCIQDFYVKGKSFREIAKLIGRSPSTVSREINRNRTFVKKTVPYYYPPLPRGREDVEKEPGVDERQAQEST